MLERDDSRAPPAWGGPSGSDQPWVPVSAPADGPAWGQPGPGQEEGPPWGPEGEKRLFNWFAPDPQARRGRMRFDSSNGMHWVAGIVLWAAVGFMALNTLSAAVLFFVAPEMLQDVEITPGLIWVNGFLLLVGLGLPPLLWVAAFYRGGAKAWAHGLFLRFQRPVWNVFLGVAAAFGMLVLSVLVMFLLSLVGYDPENPMVEDLAAFVTWPLVFWIAFSAAVGEELFFRGLLQPRIGIVASAVLFGILHLSYGVPIQVIMPLAFGFVLSALVVTTRSIVPAIVAHFVYNFSVGALLIVGRDLEELGLGFIPVVLFG